MWFIYSIVLHPSHDRIYPIILQLTNQGTEVFNIAALNLAIVYARAGDSKKQEVGIIFQYLIF